MNHYFFSTTSRLTHRNGTKQNQNKYVVFAEIKHQHGLLWLNKSVTTQVGGREIFMISERIIDIEINDRRALLTWNRIRMDRTSVL